MSSERGILAAGALAVGVSFAYGFACLLLPPGRRHWLTLSVVTLGLSLGALTLIMFWIAWLSPGRLNAPVVALACAAVGGLGLYLARGQARPDRPPDGAGRFAWTRDPFNTALVASVAVLSAAILFNAVYWPFSDWDALAIYAPIGRRIFESGALPTGFLYESYPMLVPLAYAYAHGAAGAVNESWARLVPALMAVGAAATAGAIAREMLSWRAGLAAAALVVLTPLFGRWASSGYVDVPTAFYIALAALGAWRWLQSRRRADALLTGLAAGLAMWTKSAALTLCLSLAALVALRAWVDRRQLVDAPRPAVPAGTAWMAIGILATACPFYARNLAAFGSLLPDTIWTSLARHDLASFLIMLDPRQHFLATGWLYTASLVYGVVSLGRGFRRVTVWHLLVAFVAPFLAAWWWLASYDARFLVMIVPLLAVMAGLMVEEVIRHRASKPNPKQVRRAGWIGVFLVLAMVPFALHKAVIGKRAILQNPAMTSADKHRLLLGGAYDLALAVNMLPTGSRVVGVPISTRYHLDTPHLNASSEAPAAGPPWEVADDFDFAVYQTDEGLRPPWASGIPTVFETPDGYFLYSTEVSRPPASHMDSPADGE